MERVYTAKNGVKVYEYKNPSLHGFFISLYFRGGSMYEDEGELGITHFLEHVLVRNVNKLYSMKLYSELDRHGVEFNASTYSEMVQFYLSGASDKFSFAADAAVKLLSPIALDKAEVDAERRRIKAEIRENDDKNSISSLAAAEVYRDTSLKNSITGTFKSVDKITLKRLSDYRNVHFTSENLFFYLTGNYSEDDLEKFLEDIGSVPLAAPSGKIRDNSAPVCVDFQKRGAKVSVKNSDYTMVRFNFDVDTKKIIPPVTDLIYDNLFAGYNSPFFIKMSEERGLFYDISGSTERYCNIGTLYFSFEVKEKDIYEAVRGGVQILNAFKASALNVDECMKAGYTDNAYLLYDDARELNFTFAYDSHIMDLKYKSIEERKEAYKKITPQDIRGGACEIFKSDNLVLSVKGNKKKIDTDRLREICKSLDL